MPLVANATDKNGKYTKNKVITKEFTVNSDATLSISNKYGNINVVTGTTNKIEIQVSITTNGDNEDKVQERLNQITVEFNGSSSSVSAKTIIGNTSNSWNWGNRNNVNMEINYIVKMPVTNNVKLTNDYGGINLDKLEGSATINCDYGKIDIGDLLNAINSINIDYTNNSNIDYMKNGEVNADYSTLHIAASGNVNLNADYSHLSFGTVENLDYNCDYGDIKIDECGDIEGNNDYMQTSIEKLNGSAIFDVDYGSIKINTTSENFKKIDIESSYTNIKIGVNPASKFNITATLGYGNLKYGDGFTFNKEIVKTSSKYYEGYFNNPNSNSTITLKTSYGNISLSN
jgi:hypothetical protein